MSHTTANTVDNGTEPRRRRCYNCQEWQCICGPASEASGAALDTYSISPRGSAVQGVCINRGYVVLTSPNFQIGAYPTICKSWRCLSCQRKLLALFVERALIGSSTIGPLYFITNTFRNTGSHTIRNAAYASKVFEKYMKEMRILFPKMQYLKVIELTKQGQPHFHCLVGGVGIMIDNCRAQTEKVTGAKLKRKCKLKPMCLEHRVARAWKIASKDSYINYTRRVWAVRGACIYVAKYMAKDADEFEKRKALGFGKRWTQSYGWPKLPRMVLRGTLEKAWVRVDAGRVTGDDLYNRMVCGVGQRIVEAETTPEGGWFERLGNELAIKMEEEKRLKAVTKLANSVIMESDRMENLNKTIGV